MSLWQNLLDNLKKWWAGGPDTFGHVPDVPYDSPPPLPTPLPTPPPPPPVPTNNPPVSRLLVVDALLAAHNQQRQVNGLTALGYNERLTAAAQRHADWMASNRSMDHTERPGPGYAGASFSDRILGEGYNPSSAGENIAAGQPTVDQVMRAWMASPGHRANILNSNYRDAGFGVAQDDYGHVYWCADLAAPLTMARTVFTKLGVNEPAAVVHVPAKNWI